MFDNNTSQFNQPNIARQLAEEKMRRTTTTPQFPQSVPQPVRQLAALKQEYDNSPVYVIPDQLMPLVTSQASQTSQRSVRYGEEVPRQSWQEALDSLVRGIQLHQAQNPPYIPFAPGTPTLEQKKFDWLKQAQEAELTGMYQGKPIWNPKTEDLSPTEYKIKARTNAVLAMQNVLDSLWEEFPNGPPQDAVREKVKEALDNIQADLSKSGLTQKEIEDAVKVVKRYAAATSGVPGEVLWPEDAEEELIKDILGGGKR